jgi:hypothetical protein
MAIFDLSIPIAFATAPDNDPPATRCDILAASPYDPGRKAAGVDYARIDVSVAVAECHAAVLNYPESGRLNFEFGRALEKANDVEGALDAYERAGAYGHAGGFNNIGELYRDGKWLLKNKDVAFAYFEAATSQGYPEAEYNLATLLLQNLPNAELLDKVRQLLVSAARSGYPNAANLLRSLSAASADSNVSQHIIRLLLNFESVTYHAEQQRRGRENSAQSAHPLQHGIGDRMPVAGFMTAQGRPYAPGHDINVEFLQAEIEPATSGSLAGLACRNYDKIVHLDVSVEWPTGTIDVEKTGYERLVFSTDDAEFLFPKGSYDYQHGIWIIKGYFIARNGGFHQGIVSDAFEKVDDAKVMLNPNVVETKAQGSKCP